MHTFVGFVNLKKRPSGGIEKRDVLCKLCQKSRGSCNYGFGKKKIKMHDYDSQVEDKTGQHCTKELATSWCDSELWNKYQFQCKYWEYFTGIEIKHFVPNEWMVGRNKFDLD